MHQVNDKTKIVWVKPSVFIERGLILAGILATAVMLVSLMALANVALANVAQADSVTGGQPQCALCRTPIQ